MGPKARTGRASAWWRGITALSTASLAIISIMASTVIRHGASEPPPGFVGRRGADFWLDGAPFRFVGVNIWDAAGDPGVFQCTRWASNPDVDLDEWFARVREDFGGRVVRFWAFQQYTNGGTDWRALDRVMRLATQHGLKVIPVLENHWADCTQGGRKADSWYAGGYRTPYGSYPLSYEEYVRRVVTRYRNEPAIAAWMLMNEAESQSPEGAPNPDALYTFARDMSAVVKSLDPSHLVTLGVVGSGQPGVAGASYERLHSLDTVDFLEFHDYHANDEPLPGLSVAGAVYTQDQAWTWRNENYRQPEPGVWETLTGTVPDGGQPFQRVGLNFYGSFVGNVYVDEVEIGSRRYDFENGTLQGWEASAPIVLGTTGESTYGGQGALKLSFTKRTAGAQVWVTGDPTITAGTPITVRLYVDTPDAPSSADSLAVALRKARALDKPLLVGESGMTTCVSAEGSQVETPESRAGKFDAKLDAFFAGGGAGYLIWAWEPNNSCSYAFTTGDPLNATLAKYAAQLRRD
jgi:hypothetical protein